MKAKANPDHPFFDRFEQLMAEKEKKGLGIRAAAFYCGVYPNTICGYKKKRNMPNAEQLEKLADYFRVSTDWLLGRTGGQTMNDKKFTIGDTFIHNRYGTVVVLTYYTERKASYRVHVLNNNGEVERMSYQYFKSSFRKIGHSYAFDEVLKEISKIEVQR